MQDDSYIWEEGPNSFQPNDSMLQAAVSGWAMYLTGSVEGLDTQAETFGKERPHGFQRISAACLHWSGKACLH
jgi:hypothetical protein